MNNLYYAITLSDRDKYIVAMRLLGETLGNIGNELDISAGRVRQLESKAIVMIRKYDRFGDGTVYDARLSQRTSNALVVNNIKSLDELWGLDDSELLSLRGIGEKSKENIRNIIGRSV